MAVESGPLLQAFTKLHRSQKKKHVSLEQHAMGSQGSKLEGVTLIKNSEWSLSPLIYLFARSYMNFQSSETKLESRFN